MTNKTFMSVQLACIYDPQIDKYSDLNLQARKVEFDPDSPGGIPMDNLESMNYTDVVKILSYFRESLTNDFKWKFEQIAKINK